VSGLVLSLFPGIGLLDLAFEEEGFCVVRGPDLLWGGDVRKFHPPAGRFDGVIGGPPCQAFSQANQAGRKGLQALAPDLIPEFSRCVLEARPSWFVMENVPQAPPPIVDGYFQHRFILNNRWVGGVQNRRRAITFGSSGERRFLDVEQEALEPFEYEGCFTANATQWCRDNGGYSRSQRTWASLRRGLKAQGLPENHLDHAPFTVEGAIRVVGNGVPLPMGRAVARAVKAALARPEARHVG
jgi:DNA (cytosine-5)-methyltransferase 1